MMMLETCCCSIRSSKNEAVECKDTLRPGRKIQSVAMPFAVVGATPKVNHGRRSQDGMGDRKMAWAIRWHASSGRLFFAGQGVYARCMSVGSEPLLLLDGVSRELGLYYCDRTV